MGEFEKLIERGVKASKYSKSDLEKQLSGQKPIEQEAFPILTAYHLVADSENPNSLADKKWKGKKRRFLDALATRANLADVLKKARKGVVPARKALGGTAGGGSSDAKRISASELSQRIQNYEKGREALDSLQNAKTTVSLMLNIGSLALGAGGASKAVQKGLGIVAAAIGVEMSLLEFLHSTLLADLTCCIEEIDATLKGDRPQLEDEASPEVILGTV